MFAFLSSSCHCFVFFFLVVVFNLFLVVYSTPLSEIDAKADQSFITVEEDEEVLSEQEMKKRSI